MNIKSTTMKTILTIIAMFFGVAALNAQTSFTCNFSNTNCSGAPSTTIECSGTCTNTDCCNSINIVQIIVTNSLPSGWAITMTNPNGNHAVGVTTNNFLVTPSGTANAKFNIQTDATVGNGTAEVRFENAANTSDFNQFTITATSTTTGVVDISVEESILSHNYPNPSKGVTFVNYNLPDASE